MHVLIVEDDVKLGRILVRGLGTDGIAAELVTTGREAVARARADDPPLIILDVMLPDLDGFSACRAMRDAGVKAPVLILTARDAITDRKRSVDCGADDLLLKPFALTELLARVRGLSPGITA